MAKVVSCIKPVILNKSDNNLVPGENFNKMNPGGIADKLGNRYEAKWLVRCFIDVIADKAQWMKIKPVFNSHQLIDIRDLYVELSLVANDREGLSAFNKQSLYHNDDSYSLSNSNAIITAESLLSRASERNLLIVPPGSGKSTFLRWICAYLIDDFATLNICPIPISLRSFAHQLGENADLSLWAFAWGQLSDADATPYPDNPQAFADVTTDIIFIYQLH